MALRLDGASYIQNASAPVTTTPVAMGAWVSPATSGVDQTIWSMSDTGATNQYYRLFISSVDAWSFTVQAGAGTDVASVSDSSAFINQWTFVLVQAAADDDLVINLVRYDGNIIGSDASTTAGPPTGVDSMQIGALLTSSGASSLFTGRVAEYWIANVDFGVISDTERDAFMYQLAWGGPFSIPQVANNIVEYRSLRKYPTSLGDDLTEVYWGGGKGIQTWAAVGSPTIAAHPPLPYWFARPGQYQTNLIV